MVRTYSSLHIERTIVLGFLSLIAAGAFLLWGLGIFYEVPISLIDSFFTATSAACVTGLVVTDTAQMPFLSQVTLLLLIQFGGLGVMTVTTAFLLFMRRNIGVREGLYLAGGLNADSPSGARALLLRVLGIAFLIELAGAALLFIRFRETLPFLQAVWFALFHSISAFCNAGFSLYSANLVAHAQDILTLGTVMMLIILGGLGFLVLYELWRLPRREGHLSPHSALVLQVTAGLILFGTLLFFLAERSRSLTEVGSLGWQIWNALFMSVSSRTAGFNTMSMGTMSGIGIFVLVFLMSVGASPGSTGGGLKTTTLGLMLLSTLRHLRRKQQVVYRGRLIASDNVLLALTLAVLYSLVLLTGAWLLGELEPFPFRSLLFEAASALGTVGLSLGITSGLSSPGKAVLIVLMFLGRVGILTFVIGFSGTKMESDNVSYVETSISIG